MKKALILISVLIVGVFLVSCKKECYIQQQPKERIACLSQAPDWYNPPAGSFKIVVIDETLQPHHYFGWHEQVLYYSCPIIILYEGIGISNQTRALVLEKLNRDGYAVLVEVVNPQYPGQRQLSNE